MSSHAIAARAATRLVVAGLAAGLVGLAFWAAPAWAGEWMQVSCLNPDGSAAPSDGWSALASGAPEPASTSDSRCAPGSPMSAGLSQYSAAPEGATEYLQYQPPAGSTLAGGSVDANLYADGYGTNAVGTAAVYSPAFVDAPGDVVLQCAAYVVRCNPGPGDAVEYSGAISLPAGLGGDLYVAAGCGGMAGATCGSGGSRGNWSEVQVVSAALLLSSNVSPEGSAFGGSALQRGARGVAHLVFTASDPGGPGVYSVTVDVDGRPVFSGSPNSNGGRCVAVGTDGSSGALMFDWQQPCLVQEAVDVPVPTAGLPDGSHELSVTVTDAAQNSSTVLDQTIKTSNPSVTPAPRGRGGIRARFVISWSWKGRRTRLRSIRAHGLPRAGQVTVRCRGRGCPRLRVRSASAPGVGRLLRGLGGRRFTAGDRLLLEVSAPGRRSERVQLQIRDNRLPRARLLKR